MHAEQKQLPTGNIATASVRIRIFVICIAALGVLLCVGRLPGQGATSAKHHSTSTPSSTAPAGRTAPAGPAVPVGSTAPAGSTAPLHSTNSTTRPAAPRVASGTFDSLGRPISISCASCHANFEPNLELRTGEQLQQFHQGLSFAHGKLTCLTCHNAKNYNWLRLAGEQPLDFSQAQTLCGQCHSKQSNDYERGAHGGMNGHWNLARGARVRKLCVDCHDPHAPAFPAMIPTFKSHDRFLESKHTSQSGLPHE